MHRGMSAAAALSVFLPGAASQLRGKLTAGVDQVGAVVVSPTRELARQIHSVLEPFAASVPNLTTMLLMGGSCVHHHLPPPPVQQS